jgi:hypothetical protein
MVAGGFGAGLAVVVPGFAAVQVVLAVPHRKRVLSFDKATVLRKSRRARAYPFLRFITIVLIHY